MFQDYEYVLLQWVLLGMDNKLGIIVIGRKDVCDDILLRTRRRQKGNQPNGSYQ